MDDGHRASLGRDDQLLERAGLGILHVRLLVSVVCEHSVIEIRALVAGRATDGIDVRVEKQWVVVSDCGRADRWGNRGRISGRYGHSEATVMAIAAGCDAVLMCEPSPEKQVAALEGLIHAVEKGRIPLKRIEDALARHMRAKERFLAPPRARPATGAALRAILGRDEHQAIAAEMARFA